MSPLDQLTQRADTVLALAEERVDSHPWAVVMALHEITRSVYPADPFIPFEPGVLPIDRIVRTFDAVERFLRASSNLGVYPVDLSSASYADDMRDQTGRVYGAMWQAFSPQELVEGGERLLRERFMLNAFDFSLLVGKRALDIGCGSGRYTLALKRLGAASVTGVDWGDEGLDLAERTRAAAGIEGVSFRKADVLDLPFPDGAFEFVFCNGVLHHTANLEDGLREFVRVAAPGAGMWLFLYGSGGLFWYLRRVVPKVARRIPQSYTQRLLSLLGMPGQRFIFADNWYVPTEQHCHDEEIRALLTHLGVSQIHRCLKGLPTDLDEAAAESGETGRILWGEGELRYLLQK